MHTRFEFHCIDTGLFVTIIDATAVSNPVKPVTDVAPPITLSSTAPSSRPKPCWRQKRQRSRRRNVSSMAWKCVTTTKPADANTPTVAGHTSASNALGPCHGSHATLVSVNNHQRQPSSITATEFFLIFTAWARGLVDHPNIEFVNALLTGILQGVDIGYTGARIPTRIQQNWPYFHRYRDEAHKIILDEVAVWGPSAAHQLTPLWVTRA